MAASLVVLVSLELGCSRPSPSPSSGGEASGGEAASVETPTAASPDAPDDGYTCSAFTLAGPVGWDPDVMSGNVVAEDRYRFDAAGRLLSQERLMPAMDGRSSVTFEYDGAGRVVARHHEEAVGLAAEPERRSETLRYPPPDEPAHQVVEEHDEPYDVTRRNVFTFDGEGRVVSTELVLSALRYPPGAEAGDPPERVEQRGIIRCEWDPSGRIVSMWNGPQRTRFEYREGSNEVVAIHRSVEGRDEESAVDVEPGPDGALDLWPRGDERRQFAHQRLVGDCQDVLFRLCSSAFAPPPPGGSARHRLLPLR